MGFIINPYLVQPSGPNIVTDGLVLNLDAGNTASYPGSGTTWTDLSGNNNNVTLYNGVGYSSSNGGVLTFDGTNDYASQATTYNLPIGTSARSLSCFFYINDTNNRSILGIGAWPGVGRRVNLWADSSNKIGLEIDGNAKFTSDWPGVNNWVQLTITMPSSATLNTVKVFVNGVEKSTSIVGSGSSTINLDTDDLFVGTLPGLPGQYVFKGNISNAHIYNKELTASEVLQNFNALKSRYGL